MLARVKADARWKVVVAMQGREYVKDEWRRVPPGLDAEALNNPFLEVSEGENAPSAEVLPDHVSVTAEEALGEMLAGEVPEAERELLRMVSEEEKPKEKPVAVEKEKTARRARKE